MKQNQDKTNHREVLFCNEKDASDECGIIVQRMVLGGWDVERPVPRERVVEVFIQGQEVNIVHGYIVTVRAALQDTYVDEGAPVKSAEQVGRWQWLPCYRYSNQK